MQKMGWFGAVRGHSKSSAMSTFDRAHTTSYSTLIETMRIRDIAGYLSKVADFDPPHLHSAPSWGVTPVEFRGDLWRQKTRVDAMNGVAKCRKWGSLGQLGGTQGHRQCHHSIERIRQ